MVSKKLKGMLVVTAAGAMAMISLGASAQAPAGGPPGGGMRMGAQDRPSVEQRYGLTDPALKLTAAQQTQIDKLVDTYLDDMKKLPPMAQGAPPSPEAMQARQAPRQALITAVGKVLNDDQRKTFEAAQAARRPPGGGGPGGAGGPPTRPACQPTKKAALRAFFIARWNAVAVPGWMPRPCGNCCRASPVHIGFACVGAVCQEL